MASPAAVYETEDGGALAFFAYTAREQSEAPRGGTLRVRPSGLPGTQLPAGRYRSTDSTRMTLLAAAVPPVKPRKEPVTIVGRYTGTLTVEGMPAEPGAV